MMSAIAPAILDQLLWRPRPCLKKAGTAIGCGSQVAMALERPHWLLPRSDRWPTGYTRCCPMCLSGPQPMWREDWIASNSFWCRSHFAKLVDVCPACSRRLTWSRVRFQECSCGFDLREAKQDAVHNLAASKEAEQRTSMKVLRLLGALACTARLKAWQEASSHRARHGLGSSRCRYSHDLGLANRAV